ncbi:S8 family peptidase [Streptomyces sviceus]|uniref:S8 family peptidase n=1 Tax=Streptomyces sviceus TaxID=285530 RepID=UPI00367BD5E6
MRRPTAPRPGRPWRRGRGLALLAAPLLSVPMLGVTTVPAVSSPLTAADPAPAKGRAAITKTHDITLITGDVVTVTTFKGGTQPAVQVHPEGPSGGLAVVQHTETGSYVIPQAARQAVIDHAVDLELFDVERLIADGYDDASTKVLPLVLDNSEGAGAPKATLQAKVTSNLRSINSRGVDVPKAKAKAFWQQNNSTKERKALHVGKIWLDAKVTVDLAQSVPQIGAPSLWKDGFDGKGVKVAVLDTGVDATHPDLAGRVSQQKNFSDSPDAADHFGHGTHVAATVGGSGTGNGAKGVAPGVDLISGKVLDDDGGGTLSGIIEGIEWATAERADIINMSLGTTASDDGSGPLSVAVDQATAEHGTLFVVSAGNRGPNTIGSPASARDALTVGALERDGSRPLFSSTGPRLGDYGVKPEISAPGVGIVAARAAGTSLGRPVDELYTSLDGTSMASPHVAGAAALLKQAHPQWTWQQLKSALVGSAEPGDYRVEAGGSGRVDAARAQAQLAYTVPAAVNLGAAPYVDGAPYKEVTREIAIHNDAADARTFTLTASITSSADDPLPDGAVRLSANEVTVPAGGSASVTITADPNVLTAETLYSGLVTAAATDSSASVRVPVSLYVEPPLRTITVRGTATNGKPVLDNSFLLVLDETSSNFYEGAFSNGVATVRVKPGSYAIETLLLSPDAGGEQVQDAAMYVKPEVRIGDEGVELALDARKATEVTYRTGRDTEQQFSSLGYWRSTRPAFGGLLVLPPDLKHISLFPTQAPRTGTQEITVFSTRTAPILVAKAGQEDLHPTQLTSAKQLEGKAKLKLVDVGDGSADSFAGKDVKGKLVLATPAPGPDISSVVERAGAQGAAAVAIGNTEPGRLAAAVNTQAAPAFALPGEDVRDLRHLLAGSKHVTVTLVGTPLTPYVYDLATPFTNTVPRGSLTVSVDESSHAHVSARIHQRGGAGPASYIGSILRSSGGYSSPRIELPVRRGAVLDEWFSASPQTAYLNGMAYDRSGGSVWFADLKDQSLRTQQPGHRTAEYFKAVNTSKFLVLRSDGNTLWAVGERLFDPTGLFTMRDWAGDTVRMTLYRNGTQVYRNPVSDFGAVSVLSGDADYKLVVETRRNAAGWEYSTDVSTTASFRADPQPDSARDISIPQIGYGVGVDLTNRIQADKPQQLTVTARPLQTDDAKITKVQTWASYDDGQTWSELVLAPGGADGKWKAKLKVPGGKHTPKYVSLRTVATDANGNSIDQTVKRAFGVR